jgi:predicted acylesterase/phospholipase RssA
MRAGLPVFSLERAVKLRRKLLLILLASAGALAGLSLSWMARLESKLFPVRIVDLEFAWTASKLERLLSQWGTPPATELLEAARLSFWVDFLFIAAYVLLLSGALISAFRTRPSGDGLVRASRKLLLLPVAAGAFDVLENGLLLGVLQNALPTSWIRFASGAAAVKFTLIAVVLGYCLVLWLSWSAARELARLLRPIWLHFVLLGAIAVLLIFDPQGQDVVRAAGESLSWDLRRYEGTMAPGEAVGLMVTTTLWAFATWYWVRTLLSFRFEGDEKLDGKAWVARVNRWLPGLMGASAFIVISLACFRAAETDRGFVRPWQQVLVIMAVLYLTAGVFFAWATERYLSLPEAVRSRAYKSIRRQKGREAEGLPQHVQIILLIGLLLGLTVFLAFSFLPVRTGQWFGAGATLVLAVCVWMQAGNVLIYCGLRYRFPAFRLLLGMVVLFSLVNDNHGVRLLEGRPPRLPTVQERLRDWHAALHAAQGSRAASEDSHPLYVVATEGGGIRAAYWTAAVLGQLEDTSQGEFSRHVFAISGVSGGSLGAAVFASQLAAGLPANRNHVQHARSVLGKDFLAPTLGALLFPDMVQHFLPFPLRLDRARALETAWEDSWLGDPDASPLGKDFQELWEGERRHRVPSLFLNATLVESGARVVTSDLDLQSGFPDVLQTERLSQSRMRVSTAVHLSARFPYISPGATFPNGLHVVDGGYFENSGCATAEDLLIQVSRTAQELEKETHHRIVPRLILITNGETEHAVPSHWADELLLPVQTILSTRSGRGRYAQLSILRDGGAPGEALSCSRFGIADSGEAEKGGIRLPLGWMLSRLAQEYMESQAKMITYEMLQNGRAASCLPSSAH